MLYEIYVEWHALLLKFPKAQRYSLGQTISDALLAALEAVLAAAATSMSQEKRDQIAVASTKIDLLKLLIRLAKDCECLTQKQYQSVESKLYHAGKMLGGWRKSLG